MITKVILLEKLLMDGWARIACFLDSERTAARTE